MLSSVSLLNPIFEFFFLYVSKIRKSIKILIGEKNRVFLPSTSS